MMQIETKRLLLRPWEDGDAADLYEYAKDPAVGPIAGWSPHTSVENSLEIIRGVLSEPETYAVVLKETGKAVGSVGIMLPGNGSAPMQAGEAEIGYWIGVPFWGKGLIPEAVRALQKRCFTELACRAVWCGYYDGNDKSRHVQEKCGFRYHHSDERKSPLGDLRTEHYTYLTKEEWLTGAGNAFGGQFCLETERLYLLPLTASQLSLWIENGAELERELDVSYQAEPAEGWFLTILRGQAEITARDREKYFFHTFWFLIRKCDRTVIGSADFKDVPDENGEIEIGYGLGERFCHQGYMTEAVKAMCDWAEKLPDVRHVIAETEIDGFASQKILLNCGFREYKRSETAWFRR